ncbi:MAG: immune inhibitor A [Anaerolineae bacterium]|nr:immune inhibitor A [Anaerolineae bacterium]MDW8101727.1 immune inhibitor A [Anaerolineae bacterium]
MKKIFPIIFALFLLSGCFPPNPVFTPSPTPVPLPSPTPQFTPTPTPVPVPDPIPSELPVRDLGDIAARLGKIPPGPIPTPTPALHHPGEKAVFWLLDHPSNRYFTTTATLSILTPNFCVWVEEGAKVDRKALRASVEQLEKEVYPHIMETFGPPSSPVPWSNSCIHIFNGTVPGVGGYFSGSDNYPRQVYAHSNEKNAFYLNLQVLRPGTRHYLSVLVHELQHMLQWYIDRNEDTWVNEGFSQMAEFLSGLSEDGAARAFLEQPDTQLTSWPGDLEQAYPNYGASFLFMLYFWERFGEEAFQRLVKSPSNGPQAFNEVLAPHGYGFEDLFADWAVANYLDDPDSGYGYHKLDLPKPRISAIISTLPITLTETVHQYATDYFKIQTENPVLLRFTGNTTVTLGPPAPYSGKFMWWSGRGDESNSTLTRHFNLKNTDKATLRFQTWYDLEKGYDYAYLEVSSDGGKTWKILRGLHSTSENPVGHNLGYGYTGKSGGWIEEVVDLTPWAGKEILLRFECITDDAVNRPGFFIDNVTIPEIGYHEDFERGYGGWVPNGFVYTDGVVKQGWIVQAIEGGKPPSVKRWKLADDIPFEVVLNFGAVVVVSAFAPATSEPARYTLSFTHVSPGQ